MTTQKPDNSEETIVLKDPALSALLAWLVPGLGHLYQGRWAKGIIFFVCIMGTFTYGLYLGSSPKVGWGRVVYASWKPGNKHLYYLCQVWVGLPAMPALIQAARVGRGEEPIGTFMAPAPLQSQAMGNELSIDDLHRRLGRYFLLGQVYTAIAGLLNILAIFDAWAGPMVPASGKEEEEEDDKEKSSSEDTPSEPAAKNPPSDKKDA